MPYEAINELLTKVATALKNAPDALSDRIMRRMLTEIPELRGDQRIVVMLECRGERDNRAAHV